MGSTMSALGFTVDDENEFAELLQRAADEGARLESPHGEYVRWATGGGPELWVTLYRDIAGVVPAFDRGSSMRVKVDAVLATGSDTPLEGVITGTLEHDPDDMRVPWAIEIAGLARDSSVLGPGAVVDIAVTAFAHEIEVREPTPVSAETGAPASAGVGQGEYALGPVVPDPAADDDDSWGLADQALIPIWTFEEHREAELVMSGMVVRAETCVNEATGGSFQHIVVETLGTRITVVADPDDLPDLPEPGQIVEGGFWVSGIIERVVSPARPPRRRLFSLATLLRRLGR